MAENQGGAAGKRGWPDARSLRWPPEGVAVTGESAKVGGNAGGNAVAPVELALDPGGSGAFVAVEMPEMPRTVETLVESTPVPESQPVSIPVVESDAGNDSQTAVILKELRSLRQAVDALTVAVSSLGTSSLPAAGPAAAPGIMVIAARSVSDYQARQEIQEYFLRNAGQTLYPVRIAEALNLPVLKVAELCEALAQRGQLSRDAAP